MKAQIELPPKLLPVFAKDYRYKGAYGGRGSGKTRAFAKMSAVSAYKRAMQGESGVILCGREFMNSLEESSLEEVKQAIKSEPFLANFLMSARSMFALKMGGFLMCFPDFGIT